MAGPRYLLDTNILVHFVRGSEVWTRVRDAYQPLTADPRPIISYRIGVIGIRSEAVLCEAGGRGAVSPRPHRGRRQLPINPTWYQW